MFWCFYLCTWHVESTVSCWTNASGRFLIADVDYLSVKCSLHYSGNWPPRLHWQVINESQTSSIHSQRCPQHQNTSTLCQRQVHLLDNSGLSSVNTTVIDWLIDWLIDRLIGVRLSGDAGEERDDRRLLSLYSQVQLDWQTFTDNCW